MNKILEKLKLVPEKPGVYIMRDEGGHVIYIGKAKVLRNRLDSYFHSGSHDAKVTAMLEKVRDFEWFITKSEKDALGLEANLIKKHKPHYNILLKDNKQFPYIKIVDGVFPYLEITRKITRGGKYFGPYFNGIWARDLLRTICDVFPVRVCGGNLAKLKEPCLNYQIGRCSGPCAGKISKEDYAKIIDNVKSFLLGRQEFGAREILNGKMAAAGELQQFELAIRYRDGLVFLDKLKERTITQVGRDVNCDVFGFAVRGGVFAVSVLTVRAGKLIGVRNFANESQGVQSDAEMLSDFIMQHYTENAVPELVVAALSDDLLNELAAALGCCVFRPKAALKKRLLEMAESNAVEYIETSIEQIKFKTQFTVGACGELANVLGLSKIPKKIECFDISTLGGEEQVASMVVFINGRAEKKLYRKFKIRHKEGINDYLSMQEVITRRLKNIGTDDASFGTAPDLIVVDGGKGQLSSALHALENYELGIRNHELRKDIYIDFISLAKREEEIFVPNKSEPIVLSKRSYALRLVQRLRDEAHRFAITFHKARRASKLESR